MQPLADKLRPKSLKDFIGQEHLVGENKVLNKIIESKKIPNMIIYGPPGSGKTSIVNIIANECNKNFYKINGTTTNTEQIKNIIKDTYNFNGYDGIILYIDEIHFLSKKQQQIILEFIENGSITLIGSTTENINFSIFNSILSRCITLNFKPISQKEILNQLKNIISKHFSNYIFTNESIDLISKIACGDFRKALNILELTINTYNPTEEITINHIENLSQTYHIYTDNNSDNHYNNLSYLQKSIRGSDPNAASIALALLIKSGNLESICRRLLVIACEDIGLAHPQAISITKSCVDAALMIGFPEAKIPLSQAVIFLSILPKSNSSYLAINNAIKDIEYSNIEIPNYLCDSFSNKSIDSKQSYIYPHDYPHNYVKQNYMPKGFENKIYYTYGNNKFENSIKEYWNKIK